MPHLDLFDLTTRNRTADAENLLKSAKILVNAINSPDTFSTPDQFVHNVASSTGYTAQPPGTSKDEDRPPAFPRLLAAFDAAVETVATKREKKIKEEKGFYYYNLTNFLRRMPQDQRRELRLALHADVDAIIAAAKRDATDGTPKLFDGVPLRSASTVEVRQDLDAMFQEKQKQLHALQRQINALNMCEPILKKLDDGLSAAEDFKRETLSLLGPDAPPPPLTQMEKEAPTAAKRGKKQQ